MTAPPLSRQRDFSPGQAAVLAALFLAAHLARLPFHELWRDEWQTWLTARASHGLGELVWNTRYDGHPMLWVALVWLVSRVAPAVWAMQALHAAVAAAWAWVVLRHAPFPRWTRLAFLAGYFPFFEYAVISRNYALGGLLAAVACALLGAPRLRPVALGGTLGLLAATSLYGAILALGLLLVVAVDTVGAARLPALRAASPRARWTLLALGAGGIALAMADGLPAAGSGFATEWNWYLNLGRLARSVASVGRALAPVPHPGLHFWNSHFLDERLLAQALLGAGLGGLAWLLLRGHPRARLLWLAVAAALVSFVYLKLQGSMRHHGFHALALFSAAWLAAIEPPTRPAGFLARWRTPLAAGLLAVHVAVGIYASAMDLRHPFSANVAVARWLERAGLAGGPLVGEADTRVSPLAGLLGRPIFYVRARRWGTFVIFDQARVADPTAAEVLAAARQAAAGSGGAVLVLAADPAFLAPLPADVELLASFAESIVETESYAVFRVRPPR